MSGKKDRYVRTKDLHVEIMEIIKGSGEPAYIVLEVLKMVASDVRGRKKKD